MGVDLNIAQLLVRARLGGLSFERMATLGRQELLAERADVTALLRNAGFTLSGTCERKLTDPAELYAEELFRVFGAKEITGIDASGYEGAQIVHDLNRPIPEALNSRFDLVLDAGTLEHIFNFPVAARSCLEMIRPGGRFICCSPGNNFCGHGFYQFSPELFYRLLSPANGYVLETCLIWEHIHGSRFYQMPDPDALAARIQLTSRARTYLFVQAKRVGEVPQELVLQQSDYVRCWNSLPVRDCQTARSSRLRATLKSIAPLRSAVQLARGLLRASALPPLKTEAWDRRRRLHRAPQAILTPLEDIRVRF
jgi:SAM-dependent methyltransferase